MPPIEPQAIGGHVVVLVNKHTKAASTIHWASNKIEKKVYNTTTAETMALQGLMDTIFFVKEVLEEICGNRMKNLQCMMLTSNHNLLANIRNIKSQIHPNIRDIAEKMVQEVRYVRPSLNIAEGLTRTIKTKEALQRLIQTGQ